MAKSKSPRSQAGDEALEVVLDELDAAAQFLLQRRGQIDLEALVAVRVLRILADVGRPALAVGAPTQRRQLALAASAGASPRAADKQPITAAESKT